MDKNIIAVLDASALLAYIKGENGATSIKKIINDSIMSSVNITEAIIVLGRINPDRI